MPQIILIIIGIAIIVILLTKKTREQVLRPAQAKTQNDPGSRTSQSSVHYGAGFTALEQSVLSAVFTAKQHSNILQNVGMLRARKLGGV